MTVPANDSWRNEETPPLAMLAEDSAQSYGSDAM